MVHEFGFDWIFSISSISYSVNVLTHSPFHTYQEVTHCQANALSGAGPAREPQTTSVAWRAGGNPPLPGSTRADFARDRRARDHGSNPVVD